MCAEYSPSLQLGVLGLSPDTLLEPVLDVVCGPSAGLVRCLRAEGITALGIDRAAPDDVGVVADWLTFPYGTARWGTMVSHLGLSLHFLRHQLGCSSQVSDLATAHAEAYMRVLRSLRVGGEFAYAPGYRLWRPCSHPPTTQSTARFPPSSWRTPCLWRGKHPGSTWVTRRSSGG